MSLTQKAVRATIKLGDIELDVFQLPDGSYVMSSTQIAELMGRTEKYYRPKYLSKELQCLLGERLAAVQALTKVAFESTRINPLPLDVVGICFAFEASKGNQTALGLVVASQIETLERRADRAFNVQRTEDERNERLKLRMQSKVTRRSYTDILKDKLIEQYGEDGYKTMAKQGYFRDVTMKVNQHLFKQPHFNCNRDNMTPDQLVDIEHFEKMLERRGRRYPEHTAEQLMQWMLEQF